MTQIAHTLIRWIERVITPNYQHELEQYLAQSQDIFDLEARMRRWERQQARSGTFYIS